jgi:putative SOS response-associated peptidase YedK
MCGRYALASDPDALLRFIELVAGMGILDPSGWRPRFNIAPTQPALTIFAEGPRTLRWGRGVTTPRGGLTVFNARVESLTDKPFFREAYLTGRCLVPCDGWYEWKREGRARRPFLFRRRDRAIFAFAGISWRGEGPAFAILTRPASPLAAPVHDRMPVILEAAAFSDWLGGPSPAPLTRLEADDAFESVEVSERVNSVRFDDATCQSPASAASGGEFLAWLGEDRKAEP